MNIQKIRIVQDESGILEADIDLSSWHSHAWWSGRTYVYDVMNNLCSPSSQPICIIESTAEVLPLECEQEEGTQ